MVHRIQGHRGAGIFACTKMSPLRGCLCALVVRVVGSSHVPEVLVLQAIRFKLHTEV